MSSLSKCENCPVCDATMGYDILLDEHVCRIHGRFWWNGREFKPSMSAAACLPDALPRVGFSPNAAQTNVMALLRG